MKPLVNTFLKGLVFTLPQIITFGLIYWLFSFSESLLKAPLQWLLPEGAYIPGMGVASLLVIIFVNGVLVQAYLIKHLFRWLELLVERIPFVKTLYTSSRDLMHFAAGEKSSNMRKVVMVTFDGNAKVMGFVTKENVAIKKMAARDESSDTVAQEKNNQEQADKNAQDELLAVYIPMSFQMGGYLVYVPKSRCEFVDIPVQQAMQQVLTAHMAAQSSTEAKAK